MSSRCASSGCRPRSREGPCLSAYDSGKAVAGPGPAPTTRFPRFGPAAPRGRARRGVHLPAAPRRRPARRAGPLPRHAPGRSDPHDMGVAQTLADVAAAYLLNAQAREEVRATADRFHHIALHDPLTGLPNRLLLAAAPRARGPARPAVEHQRRDPVRRPRPVQAGQRHLRPPRRRRAAARRRAPAHRARPAGRHAGPGLAATSSCSCARTCRAAADAEILARRIDGAFAHPFVLSDMRARDHRQRRHGVRRPGRGDLRRAGRQGRHRDVPGQAQGRRRPPDHRPARGAPGHRPQLPRTRPARRVRRTTSSRSRTSPSCAAATGWSPAWKRCCAGRTPNAGAVPPMSWSEIAEQSELICEIGEWVLERSCRDRVAWLREHPQAPLDLAVNVSARQLMDPRHLRHRRRRARPRPAWIRPPSCSR